MPTTISHDRRALVIDGKRTLLLSGSIHYCRSTPDMWPRLMKASKDAGLNAVETYVFWNLHERERGVYDFSGRLDLFKFCKLAQEHGLHVILRIGPYICAETNYGGWPFWLREVPGMRMRTWNEPFMAEMGRWVRAVCDHLRPMFAPQGGPIILAQIENEYDNVAKNYGEDGKKYLQWSVDFARSLDMGVPWITCKGGSGGTSDADKGSISTINGFYGHDHLDNHFKVYPDQPPIWTEHWTAWYDTWGDAQRVRPAEDVAYALARFFAAGGAGNNYYMWHGGTDFARQAMYLQTTMYYPEAPLDEYGNASTKYHHVNRIHRVLLDHEKTLLGQDTPEVEKLGDGQASYAWGKGDATLRFVCNDGDAAATVSVEGKSVKLASRSVQIVHRGKVLTDTAEVRRDDRVSVRQKALPGSLDFAAWPEPMPASWPPSLPSVTVKTPVEQLQFTQDETDYCWYTTEVDGGRRDTAGTLSIGAISDLVHVFLDGKLVASTPCPLMEDRGAIDSDKFRQEFTLTIPRGRHELSLLCCGVGLVKGDWQIGHRNMVDERKGIWAAVRFEGKAISGWTIRPGLLGEVVAVGEESAALLKWKAGAKKVRPMTWLRTSFDTPRGVDPITLDLGTMTKGIAWVNGECIGRYWTCSGTRGVAGWMQKAVKSLEPGKQPTQRYYHVPREWLIERGSNTLVMLEEVGGDATGVKLCRVTYT